MRIFSICECSRIRIINFDIHELLEKTIFETFGPGRYNQEIDNIINKFYQINGVPTITEYRALEHFNFVNDHSFAKMGPPFKLMYKSTKDAWQKAIPLQDY